MSAVVFLMLMHFFNFLQIHVALGTLTGFVIRFFSLAFHGALVSGIFGLFRSSFFCFAFRCFVSAGSKNSRCRVPQRPCLWKKEFRKIFEPGFTTKKRGWGLGLSLTKRIVEEYHKGKIKVLNSEIGKGTTMQISFKKSKDV